MVLRSGRLAFSYHLFKSDPYGVNTLAQIDAIGQSPQFSTSFVPFRFDSFGKAPAARWLG